jgi:hypothetical protein
MFAQIIVQIISEIQIKLLAGVGHSDSCWSDIAFIDIDFIYENMEFNKV